MRIAFEAGAVARRLCFFAASSNVSALEELVTLQGKGILDWVSAGMLDTAVSSRTALGHHDGALCKWVLSSLNSAIIRRVNEGSWVGQDVIATSEALARAFQVCLSQEKIHEDTAKGIYDTWHQWGFQSVYSRTNEILSEAVLHLCDSQD